MPSCAGCCICCLSSWSGCVNGVERKWLSGSLQASLGKMVLLPARSRRLELPLANHRGTSVVTLPKASLDCGVMLVWFALSSPNSASDCSTAMPWFVGWWFEPAMLSVWKANYLLEIALRRISTSTSAGDIDSAQTDPEHTEGIFLRSKKNSTWYMQLLSLISWSGRFVLWSSEFQR